MQPLNLFYDHNVITESIGYVFVNTESRGLPYKNASSRGECAVKLLSDVLEFKQVETFTNLTKVQIIEKLTGLDKKAALFTLRE